jgi:hypothetical protein
LAFKLNARSAILLGLVVLSLCLVDAIAAHAGDPVQGDISKIKISDEYYGGPTRRAFFKTIELAVGGNLDAASACANAQKGMRLAIRLTADPVAYRADREAKRGYILEDFAKWAMMFLAKSCQPDAMKPLVEELLKVEAIASKPEEPGLAFASLNAAKFFRDRCCDAARAEEFFDQAARVIPKVKYEKTHSSTPEFFAVDLKVYEEDLAVQPLKAAKYKKIRILRIQQQARHINNVGNAYLKPVYGPPAETGLHEYEVNHAVDAYSKAIELIPKWAEPYRGRARAYELLGKHDLAAKDRAKAKQLE